eukprot:10097998-Alexandrium_andersonii.AAC.1
MASTGDPRPGKHAVPETWPAVCACSICTCDGYDDGKGGGQGGTSMKPDVVAWNAHCVLN